MNESRKDDSWSRDRELHSTIALASGNLRLADEISRYGSIVQVIREAAGADSNILHPISIAEHLRILECLRDRNSKTAAKAMEDHLSQARASAREALLRMREQKVGHSEDPGGLRVLSRPKTAAGA
jgi:DNA-binding GntR family transcriptional regulator